MKKNRFILCLLAIILSVTMFAGCTKSSSAKIEDINSMFTKNVKYSFYTDSSKESGILLKQAGSYVFDFNQTNTTLTDQINSVSNPNNPYSMLREGEEYDYLIKHSSKFYFQKILNNELNTIYAGDLAKINQEKLTELYNKVEIMTQEINKFVTNYKSFATMFEKSSLNSIGTLNSFEDMLKQYKKLIGATLDVNLLSMDIELHSLYPYTSPSALKIKSGDVIKLISAFELYTTYYIYQRYCVLNNSTQLDFLSGNTLVQKVNALVAKINSLPAEIDNNDTYKFIKQVESTMMQKIEANNYAVHQLQLKQTEANADYQNAIRTQFESFESELSGYLDVLDSLI